jgi:hypothetical protein
MIAGSDAATDSHPIPSHEGSGSNMPGPGERISFQLKASPSDTRGRGPLVMTIQVGPDIELDFLPEPYRAQSTIGQSAHELLRNRGLVADTPGPRCLLQDLRIEGYPIPDLEVTVYDARNVSRLGADFFRNYAQVMWDPATNVVTLVP